MKIGITCYPTYGGSGIVATELGQGLADRGHDLHFISYALPQRLNAARANIQFHEVAVTTYPLFDHAPYALALAAKMAEVAAGHNLDLLHCHYAIPHSVSAYLARAMLLPRRLRTVTTLHGTDITLVGADRSYLPITRFSIEQSDGVTAVSAYLADATHGMIGADREIEVIPNFVDCAAYAPAELPALRSHFAPGGEKLLIHVSNFRPVKRPVEVVRIFEQVAREIPAKLLMVGDGPERGRAEWAAREAGLERKVHFLGKQDSIGQWIGTSDLLLLPSLTESFGLVALEAMACGVPVVASRVGGLPEVVTDGEEGFLVEPGDIPGMARRALEILTRETLAERMAQNGRRKALERFCAARIIPMYEAHYPKVLESA